VKVRKNPTPDVESILWTGLGKAFCPEGTQVIVTWQFTARGCKKPNPSVGNGMIGWEGTSLNLGRRTCQ